MAQVLAGERPEPVPLLRGTGFGVLGTSSPHVSRRRRVCPVLRPASGKACELWPCRPRAAAESIALLSSLRVAGARSGECVWRLGPTQHAGSLAEHLRDGDKVEAADNHLSRRRASAAGPSVLRPSVILGSVSIRAGCPCCVRPAGNRLSWVPTGREGTLDQASPTSCRESPTPAQLTSMKGPGLFCSCPSTRP